MEIGDVFKSCSMDPDTCRIVQAARLGETLRDIKRMQSLVDPSSLDTAPVEPSHYGALILACEARECPGQTGDLGTQDVIE